jgi:hypothetical protein
MAGDRLAKSHTRLARKIVREELVVFEGGKCASRIKASIFVYFQE